jgi:biotin-dependent carboxylase-like uncharacterized protein
MTTPSLRVLAPGLLTTVQDLGRHGYQNLGIPVGGALDSVSLHAANALAGNAPGTAALEVAYLGPTLEAVADDVRIAIAGARAAIDILPDATSPRGTRIEGMRTVRLRRGEVLRIGSLSGGAVLYIAVEGGFDIEPVLGSVSTYLRGGFGGWQGRALAAGDELPIRQARAHAREETRFDGFELPQPARFRVIAGPQSDHFSESDIASFFLGEYTVCPGSDRMGMRLDGRRLHHKQGFDIVSDGIAPGSIQVPGTGQPIVLLADRQTTGGYPKIATVISADMPALGRVPIGAKIAFEPVSVEEAQEARRLLFEELQAMHDKIVPLPRTDADVADRLFDCNLISGVIDAAA